MDKLLKVKNDISDRIKNIGLIRGLQIGSGIAVLAGAVLINLLAGDDLVATDILDSYGDDAIKANEDLSEIEKDDEPIVEID